MSCFIIAEAGVNHNGDLALAKELILAAKKIGADAVKFQTFKAESLVNRHAQTAQYQQQATGQSSQFEMLKRLELSEQDHQQLAQLAKQHDIEFMSTAFSAPELDFLIELGITRIKIPSGEVTNLPFIKTIAEKQLPTILSTGMCDLTEVKEAVSVFQQYSQAPLTLLHCTSNYPTALHDVNLRAMQTLAQTFSLAVGYSDHTAGVLVPSLAVAMGATVIEKHFTLDKNLPGPDHQASLDVDEFQQLVSQIRDTETCLGDGVKQPRATELPVRECVRRSVTLNRAMKQGEAVTEQDIVLLRPGTGILPKQQAQVIGCRLTQDLAAGTSLQWEHLQS